MNDHIFQDALCIHRQGDLDSAEKMYREILDADQKNTAVLHLLAILLAQKQDYSAAKNIIDRAILESPTDPSLYVTLGNILKNLNHLDDAIANYQTALRMQPNSSVTHNNLGNVYYHREQFKEATTHYLEALRIDPNYADAHFNLALIFTRINQEEKAIEQLRLAIQLQPTNAKAHYHLAQLMQLQGNIDLAVKHYQNTLRLNNENIDAHHNLGAILSSKGKFGAAIRHFKKTLFLQPNHTEALHNLGSIYLKQKNPVVALKYFLHLSQLVHDFDTEYNLGVIYMDLRRDEEAIVYFNRALTIQSQNISTYLNLGAVYLRQRDYAMAAKHYQAALALQPDNDETKYILDAINQTAKSNAAPAGYVKNLFDQYASNFEQHLELLEYRVPKLLYAAISEIVGEEKNSLNILDLGCGTGLAGKEFRGLAKRLIGIDLSEKMLEIARAKKIYDELDVMSMTEALKKYHNLDLILAADSLVYLGDLDDLFAAGHQALATNGLFAFTVETTDEYPYILQRSARFAHSIKYIEALTVKNNFVVIRNDKVMLRKQQQIFIEGRLLILVKKNYLW